MSKRFSQYKKEERQEERKAEVKKDEVVERLVQAWRSTPAIWDYKTVYSCSRKLIKGLKFSPREIEQFCISLTPFQNEEYFSFRTAIFLSALINKGISRKNDVYTINTTHFSEPLDFFGYRNRKKILVIGNIGAHVGLHMEKGSIVVEGNAGVSVGSGMEFGTIIIKGNCDGSVGVWMKGGEIFIEGNAGGQVGLRMTAGEIHVAGTIESIGYMDKRRIYHRGRLIVDK